MSPRQPVTTIVVPTIGRPSLRRLLDALRGQVAPVDVPVIVVDDRPGRPRPISAGELDPAGELDLTVLRSSHGGPARARNLGWRAAATRWVSFLDDDVEPQPGWFAHLLGDLAAADEHDKAGSQGRIVVPPPAGRRPTDAERGTLGLVGAPWITADMSIRRSALARVGGFDERFRRAFREDADLAVRLDAETGSIAQGDRVTVHPPATGSLWSSLRQQRGNADDQLMRRVHGPDWRARARAPRGRFRRHLLTTGGGALALLGALTGRRVPARFGATVWAATSGEFFLARVLPGPRTPAEITRMLLTSLAIPPAAVGWTAWGWFRHRRALPWRGLPDAVLFDRDGTLVHNVPYNHDPNLLRPVEGASAALARLRQAGVPVAVVTNQSGIGSGRLDAGQVEAVNRRLEEELGPFAAIHVCPHAPDAGCDCRKPQPGLVRQACADLEAAPERTVLIGDIGSDVQAALAAGARPILVPTAQTRAAEVAAATHVAPDLTSAVDDVLGGRW